MVNELIICRLFNVHVHADTLMMYEVIDNVINASTMQIPRPCPSKKKKNCSLTHTHTNTLRQKSIR